MRAECKALPWSIPTRNKLRKKSLNLYTRLSTCRIQKKKVNSLKRHDATSAILNFMLVAEHTTLTLNGLKINQTDKESHKYLEKVYFLRSKLILRAELSKYCFNEKVTRLKCSPYRGVSSNSS